MVKIPPSKVDEELKKQDDDVYGTDYTDGGPGKFEDTEEMLENVIGNKPDPERDGFELAEEIDDDEDAQAHDKPEEELEEEE